MKYILPTLLIFILLFAFCKQKTSFDEKEIEKIREELNASHDTKKQAIFELESFYDEMNKEQKAIYGYTIGEQLSHSTLIYEIDQLQQKPEKYIDFAIQYYTTTEKNIKKLAYCYLGKSALYRYIRSYQAAIEYTLDALELANEVKDNQLLGIVYYQLGTLSGYQDETEKSLEYKYTALHYFQESGDKESEAKAYMAITWNYLSTEKDKEALETAFKVLELTKDSIKMGEALLDIGSSYHYLGQYDSALYYIKQSINYPYIHTSQAARYTKLSYTFAYLEENDSAIYYAKKALELPIDIYFEQTCYRILTGILAEAGDKNEELPFYIQKFKITQDSIATLEKQPNITILEQLRTLDKQTIKIKNHRSYLVYGIFFLLVLSSVSIFYLYKKHRRKKEEAEGYKTQLEEKEEIIDTQHEELEKQYEWSLMDIKEELKRCKEKYTAKRAKSSFEERQEIDRTIYNEVLHVNNEQAFITRMNHILNGLPDKLKKEYPEIVEKEIMWCCLFMLQLSSNDIALILDYKQTSLYKLKQRLAKKLGFTTAKELEQMLYDKVNL